MLFLPAPLPFSTPLSALLPSCRAQICQLWEESATGCPALLASRGPWDGATPVLGEPGGCEGERRPCPGMAWGLGQDTGRARVSPVSTRGFPDPCPGIVCLRMSQCRAPGSHPSQLPSPAPPCPPANRRGTARAQFSHCQPPGVSSTGGTAALGPSPWPVSVWGLGWV